MTFLHRTGKLARLTLLVLLAAAGSTQAGGADGSDASSVPAVADFHTGLALSGYDPVAYFVDAKPVRGRQDLEYSDHRGSFRFRNEGNRAAFIADPEVYAPQFSGYDPMALARGIALPGNPLEWEISGGRLYLFYSPQDHGAFKADPEQSLATAAKHWPDVAKSIIP